MQQKSVSTNFPGHLSCFLVTIDVFPAFAFVNSNFSNKVRERFTIISYEVEGCQFDDT